MLSPEELALLEALLTRARTFAGLDRATSLDQPGADPHWDTSLLLVGKIRDNGEILGTVLRPHRSGAIEAHYAYSLPEVIRVGRSPFPPPCRAVRDQSYLAWCPECTRRG